MTDPGLYLRLLELDITPDMYAVSAHFHAVGAHTHPFRLRQHVQVLNRGRKGMASLTTAFQTLPHTSSHSRSPPPACVRGRSRP